MPRLIVFLGTLLTIGSLCGCDHVLVDNPIGAPLSKEGGEKLDGTWQFERSTIELKYMSQGRVVMAALEWNDKQECFEKKESTLLLTRVADHIYCLPDSAPESQEDELQGHLFCRVEHDEKKGVLRVCLPRAVAFAAAIRGGRLTGTVTKKNKRSMTVRITATPAELEEFFSNPEADELFENPQNEVFAKRLEGWNKKLER